MPSEGKSEFWTKLGDSQAHGTLIKELLADIERFPECAEFKSRLARSYALDDQIIPALEVLDGLIVSGHAKADDWNLTAQLLAKVSEFAQAANAFEHCLAAGGNDADTHHEYGRTLFKLGRIEQATEAIEQAIALRDDMHFWRSLATIAPGNPGYDHEAVRDIRNHFATRLAQEETKTAATGDAANLEPLSLASQTDRKIRIGYVSAWFHRENYMKPVWAVLNAHDRNRFELHLFSDKPLNDDSGFDRKPVDQIHDTNALSNRELREMVVAKQIDILVDLNAYSTPDRLGVFLFRSAKVTVAWFNMFATSGFKGVDYIIGDKWCIRDEEHRFYEEQPVVLDQSYLSFDVTHDAPEIADPPMVSNGFATFGSLVTMYKLTDETLDLWCEILEAVPTAKLFLANILLDSNANANYLASRFESRGVDRSRLILKGRAEHFEFLRYYDCIDIALDAVPYNGGTTTTEAIWQGVPVVAMDGDRWACRTSASILGGTHLSQFVAQDAVDYVRLAVEWAPPNQLEQLQELRRTARTKLLQSSVCDAEGLARSLESAFQNMLRTASGEQSNS